MPPERRVNALISPRSPLLPSLPHQSTTHSANQTAPYPHFNSVEGTPSLDSYPTSYHSDQPPNASPIRRGHHRRLSKQQQLRNELQLRHEKSIQQQDQLRTAYLEFHRQRVEYQQQRQPDQRAQSRHTHPPHRRTLTSRAVPNSARPSSTTNPAIPAVESFQLHPSSAFPSFISASAPPTRHPSPLDPSHRAGRNVSPRPLTPPPSRTNQYSDWATVRERERARLLSHLTSFRETLGASVMAPPPRARHLARENLRMISERIKRRRARARETILYDLHQGVKSVEAQVHKQVEMVLSRLKDAPGSRYAFALTHSFLSQIPALTYSGWSDGDGVDEGTAAQSEGNSGQNENQTEQDQQQQQQQQQHKDLEASFDAVALGCDSSDAQQGGQRQLSLSSSGASEVLSACLNTSYTTACSQVLSAALPSFIPSMVAPLVCVFSYPAPSTTAPRSESKGFVYPWGLPDDGLSDKSATTAAPSMQSKSEPLDTTETSHQEGRHSASPHGAPDSGIVVLHSKSWTQAEREALYLAATRFRLQGQWSKIREMMNLHRTDKEIETEYKKLYCPREDDALDQEDEDSDVIEDMDEHDDEELEPMQGMQSSDSGMDEDQDGIQATVAATTSRFNNCRRRAATTDGEADDEAETEPVVFMKFGGTQARRSQSQMQSQLYQYRQSQYPTAEQQVLDHSRSPLHERTHDNDSPIRDDASHFQSSLSLYPIPSLDSSPVDSRPMTPLEHRQQPHGQNELTMDPRQRSTVTEQPIRIFKSEFMIDKRFVLEEIPMHI